jgi:plasmid maintenance system antidote protein VapI
VNQPEADKQNMNPDGGGFFRVGSDEDGNPTPLHPGQTLKVIFEGNFGISLGEVSRRAKIDLLKLESIVDGEADIDIDVAYKLKGAVGDVAEVLYRLQYAYDFFKTHHVRPPAEDVYSIVL